MTSQLIAIVLCTHGQRAVEQRPSIAAARGVSDTVSHWRTRTARNHSRARLPEGVGLLWASQRGKAMRHYCLLCFRTVTRPQWWMLRPTYYTPSICRAPLLYTLPALRPCCDNATKVDDKAHLQYLLTSVIAFPL